MSTALIALAQAACMNSPKCWTFRCLISLTRCPPTHCRAGQCRVAGATAMAKPARRSEKEKDRLIKRETLELVRAYDKIDEERVRHSIFATVKALGEVSHARLFASRRQR